MRAQIKELSNVKIGIYLFSFIGLFFAAVLIALFAKAPTSQAVCSTSSNYDVNQDGYVNTKDLNWCETNCSDKTASLECAKCNFKESGECKVEYTSDLFNLALKINSKQCSGGVDEGTCSPDKPSMCVNGTYVDKASECGCPDGYKPYGDICIVDSVPVVTQTEPFTVSDITSVQAVFSWANDVETTGIVYVKKVNSSQAPTQYVDASETDAKVPYKKNHKVVVNNLTPDTYYYAYAEFTTRSGKKGKSGYKFFFTKPVKITNITVNKFADDPGKVKITWNTNTGTSNNLFYKEKGSASWNVIEQISSDSSKTSHFVVINGLKPETVYSYYIVSRHSSGAQVKSAVKEFSTLNNDQSVVTQTEPFTVSDITSVQAVFSWANDVETTGIVYVKKVNSSQAPTQYVDASGTDSKVPYKKNHKVVVNNLTPDTYYYAYAEFTTRSGKKGKSGYKFFFTKPVINNSINCSSNSLLGDANGDGKIDSKDLELLNTKLGNKDTDGSLCCIDLDRNGQIQNTDKNDYLIPIINGKMSSPGTCSGSSSSSNGLPDMTISLVGDVGSEIYKGEEIELLFKVLNKGNDAAGREFADSLWGILLDIRGPNSDLSVDVNSYNIEKDLSKHTCGNVFNLNPNESCIAAYKVSFNKSGRYLITANVNTKFDEIKKDNNSDNIRVNVLDSWIKKEEENDEKVSELQTNKNKKPDLKAEKLIVRNRSRDISQGFKKGDVIEITIGIKNVGDASARGNLVNKPKFNYTITGLSYAAKNIFNLVDPLDPGESYTKTHIVNIEKDIPSLALVLTVDDETVHYDSVVEESNESNNVIKKIVPFRYLEPSKVHRRVIKLRRRISDLENKIIELEKKLVKKVDQDIVNRTRGKILLQVENSGEAWYVDPKSENKFYMRDGRAAYDIIKALGLGIKTSDLNKIPIGVQKNIYGLKDSDGDGIPDKAEIAIGTDPKNKDSDGDGYDDKTEVLTDNDPIGSGKYNIDSSLVSRLIGRVVLQVEDNGEAWYINPADKRRYYLGDPESAFNIMRFLSLGIKNEDLRKIQVGEFE